MKILDRIKNFIFPEQVYSGIKLMSQRNYGSYLYDGQYYKSDIVRSAIRPFASFVGKLEPQTRGNKNALLEELLKNPNPFMTMQVMLEKTANCLKLNNNAFIGIYRNAQGKAISLFPVSALSARKIYSESGKLSIEFTLTNGNRQIFDYENVIHIRKDFTAEDDIFGDSPADTFKNLMEVVQTSDNSIISAVKNGGVIQWLVKYHETYKAGHLKEKARGFSKDFLEDGSSVVATDAGADVTQIQPHDYVPNGSLQASAKQRIYSYLGTNENIVQSNYSEAQFQAYYESEIEPVSKQLSEEFTRKILSLEDRLNGTEIIFSSNSLQFASMQTKLNLLQMVDRGAMTPNEWRAVLNLSAIEGGDEVIRRLDTAVIKEQKDE